MRLFSSRIDFLNQWSTRRFFARLRLSLATGWSEAASQPLPDCAGSFTHATCPGSQSMESRPRSGIGVIAFGVLTLCCWLGPQTASAADQSQVHVSPSVDSMPSRPSLIRPHREQQEPTTPPHESPATSIQPRANSLIKRPASDETTHERASTEAVGPQQRETGTGGATAGPASSNSQPLKPTPGLLASPSAGASTGNSTGTGGAGPTPPGSSRGVTGLMKRFPDIAPSLPVAPPSPAPNPVPSPSLPSEPPSIAVGSVTLTWQANREPDLAGYKIYVGTSSGSYGYAGSPFVTGDSTAYILNTLPKGQTYFFAISAYDLSGNESSLSSEVSKTLY